MPPISAKEAVLRLIPDEMALCLVFEDLREHAHAIERSPFLRKLAGTPLAKQIAQSTEAQKLGDADEFLKQALGLTTTELRNDILGDVLALAYLPGPPGKPEAEQGLLALWARDKVKLASLVDRLIGLRKSAGQLREVVERTHQSRRYTILIGEQEKSCYWLHENLFVLGSNELLIRQVIDREGVAIPGQSKISQELAHLGIEQAFASVLLRPRAFDALLRQKLQAAEPAKLAALRELIRYWGAIDGLSFSVKLGSELEFTASARGRPEALPEAGRALLTAAAQPSSWWRFDRGPAIFRLGLSLEPRQLLKAADRFISESEDSPLSTAVEKKLAAAFGPETMRELFAMTGSEIGLSLLPPVETSVAWTPAVRAGISVNPGKELEVWNAISVFAAAVMLASNHAQPGAVSLRAGLVDGREVKSLVGAGFWLPGLEPSATLRAPWLLFADSPSMLKSPAPQGQERPSHQLIASLDFRALSSYLQARRKPIVELIAKKDKLSSEAAETKLEAMITALDHFEKIELRQAPSPGRVLLSLRVRMSDDLAPR